MREQSKLPEAETITIISNTTDFLKYQEESANSSLHLINMPAYHEVDNFSEIADAVSASAHELLAWNVEVAAPDQATTFLEMIAETKEVMNTHKDMSEKGRSLFDQVLSSMQEYIEFCQEGKRDESLGMQKDVISSRIDALKTWAHEEDLALAERIKNEFLDCIKAHENTLLFIGMGSYGDNVDELPFIKVFMSDESILRHSLLVEGLSILGKRDPNSSFTEQYASHVIKKPYQTRVYNSNKGRYMQECGTFFSSSLAVVDAYNRAKEGNLYRFNALKEALLRSEKAV